MTDEKKPDPQAEPIADQDLDAANGGFNLKDLGAPLSIPGGDQFIANGGGLPPVGVQDVQGMKIPGGDQFIANGGGLPPVGVQDIGSKTIPGGDQFNRKKR
ncbi:MAG: hypothetical protein AAF674_04195 [Pseudomonadota bacterium]